MNYPISTNPIKLDNQEGEEEEDDNGNRASVAEIRRKFDTITGGKPPSKAASNGVVIESKPISENRFKKQDADNSKPSRRTAPKSVDRPILNGDVNMLNGKAEEGEKAVVEVENGGRALGGAQDVAELGKNHTTNFASYIWSNDYKNEEAKEEEQEQNRYQVSRFCFPN